MSQQHLLLDFCPQPLQNRAMGRPIIQVESHNMRTDRSESEGLIGVDQDSVQAIQYGKWIISAHRFA